MYYEAESLNAWHKFMLVFLRFSMGWHFFYQGFGKRTAPGWSGEGYLAAGWGPFRYIAENPSLLGMADAAVMWGLVILGILMMLGLFTQTAVWLGVLMMAAFYISVPPLDYTGFIYESGDQGTELYVNKIFIEFLALMLVGSFRTGKMAGLDILLKQWRRKRR